MSRVRPVAHALSLNRHSREQDAVYPITERQPGPEGARTAWRTRVMRVSRSVAKRVAIVVVAALAAAAVPALSVTAASPGVGDGGVVANAVPAAFTPNIVDGAVESMVQVGNLMVVGGSFTQVTPTAGAGAGTTVTRNYLFAFNATTGALDTSFAPSVNGEVDAIVADRGRHRRLRRRAYSRPPAASRPGWRSSTSAPAPASPPSTRR